MTADKMKRYRKYKSPIGTLMIVADNKALTNLLLEKEVQSIDPDAAGWVKDSGEGVDGNGLIAAAGMFRWPAGRKGFSPSADNERLQQIDKEENGLTASIEEERRRRTVEYDRGRAEDNEQFRQIEKEGCGISAHNEERIISAHILDAAEEWLDRYFDGDKMKPPEIVGQIYCPDSDESFGYEFALQVGSQNILLRPEGSEFRQEVWRMLCEIPFGKTVTYGELAGRMALLRNKTGMSAQAVGGAVGNNPISIIIPCHRVIGSDGRLVGFGGGIPAKIKLLNIEGATGFRE